MPRRKGKRAREQLSSSDLDDNSTFTSDDRKMLQNVIRKLEKLNILDELKADVADLKKSVEYNHAQMVEIKKNHTVLKEEVTSMKRTTTQLTQDNEKLRSELLDLRCRNMRDNLLIMGLEETKGETYNMVEILVRSFLLEQLGIPEEEVKKIHFERAHRLGQRKEQGKPRPVVVKFSHSRRKEEVLALSKKLQGTRFFMTNQYPFEVVEKRRKLIPVMKTLKGKGHNTRLVADKLYVDGALYKFEEQQGLA